MLNNSGPRYKRSQLEQQMNIDVIWCVVLLIVMCVLGAFGCNLWLSTYVGLTVPFLPFEVDPGSEAFLTFWTFVIILQIMIPLSLYVTLELCKLLQVYHIHNNVELFCTETNKRSECRAMNITEELGQIQYIFSDKTGTLTENKMIFRRCAINGVDYNHPATELEKAYLKPGSPVPPVVANQNLVHDMAMLANLPEGGEAMTYTHNAQRIHEFLLVMAICNTVVVSASPHRDSMNASGVIEEDSELRGGGGEGGRGGGAVVNSPSSRSICSGNNDDGDNNLAASSISHNGPVPVQSISDRYTRLTESRSITPSPPLVGGVPPTSLAIVKQQPHIPSLSPISSSTECSPMSESPQLHHRSSNIISPTAKAKSIIVSKFSLLSSVLQNKNSAAKKGLLSRK